MRTAEVNEQLVGKKVNGIFTAMPVTGTIIGIVEDKYIKGVKIKLDHAVQWGDDFYEDYESVARKCDDWGNLKHTVLA